MADADEPRLVEGRTGVVGLGLIGGSMAKAIHNAGREVYAYDRSDDVMGAARVETIDGTLDEGTVPTCELIILACYPRGCVEWLRRHAGLVDAGALVIDIAGVKRAICEACQPIAREHGFAFCGCHPMAGTQHSGFAHATATLFEGAPLVACPDTQLEDVAFLEQMDRLKALLAPCGFGSVVAATPERHDRMIAFTSQLAHVVSNAYIKSPTAADHRGFSAGSYRDLTRVAQLNPAMWRELFLDDADNLSSELGHLIAELQKYKDALDAGDGTQLEQLLAEGDRLKRKDESQ